MHRQGNASRGLGSGLASILLACLVVCAPSVGNAEEEMSAECVAYRADIDANIGDIIRAGCEPSLGQMSKLIDNPIGNVAMWINQVDLLSLTNDNINSSPTEYMSNYMGILQFPTSIAKDWNIIHRAVYSIPSVPIS
jgi:hypothetical protein